MKYSGREKPTVLQDLKEEQCDQRKGYETRLGGGTPHHVASVGYVSCSHSTLNAMKVYPRVYNLCPMFELCITWSIKCDEHKLIQPGLFFVIQSLSHF